MPFDDTALHHARARDLEREAAHQRLVGEFRRHRRASRPAIRVAVGQRLVRMGERLAGAPPDRAASGV